MASPKGDQQRTIKKIKSACEDAVERAVVRIEDAEDNDSVTKPARTFAANEIRRLAKAAITAIQQNKRVPLKPKKMPDTHRLSKIVNTTIAEVCQTFDVHLDNYFG